MRELFKLGNGFKFSGSWVEYLRIKFYVAVFAEVFRNFKFCLVILTIFVIFLKMTIRISSLQNVNIVFVCA